MSIIAAENSRKVQCQKFSSESDQHRFPIRRIYHQIVIGDSANLDHAPLA
jgi:hypothetical protein